MSTSRLHALALAFLVSPLSTSAYAEVPPGFEVVNITDDPETDRSPALNDCGQIVYVKVMGTSSELHRYDNGKTERLTNDTIADKNPDMNNDGWIVWRRAVGPEDVHGSGCP